MKFHGPVYGTTIRRMTPEVCEFLLKKNAIISLRWEELSKSIDKPHVSYFEKNLTLDDLHTSHEDKKIEGMIERMLMRNDPVSWRVQFPNHTYLHHNSNREHCFIVHNVHILQRTPPYDNFLRIEHVCDLPNTRPTYSVHRF